MSKTSKAPPSDLVPTPELRAPTDAESRAIERARENLARRPGRLSLSLKHKDGEGLTISNPHRDGPGWGAHINDTFGTTSDDFAHLAFQRIATAAGDARKAATQTQANAALALMGAVAPENELEAAIGEQIIAAHTASLDFLNRARMNAGDYRDAALAYTNAATKLTRSMALMVETLARLRSGGRQRIEVIYVNGPAVLGQNAQAIITGGEGATGGKLGQSHALDVLSAAPLTPSAEMRGQDAARSAMPGRGRARSATLPDARRDKPGRTDG